MKVLLIDDHALIREALRSVFGDICPGAEVFDAVSGAEARAFVRSRTDLDLIMLDLALPDASGLNLLTMLRSDLPKAFVVVLSASSDSSVVARALLSGARGFIPKSAPYSVMMAALRLVLAGGIYVPPEILAAVTGAASADNALEVVGSDATQDELALTDRQRDVLALLVQGKSNKLICRELHLAEPTVKNHITAILKALKVSSRTEAIVAVGARGSARRP